MGCEKCKNYVGEERNKQGIFTLCNVFGLFNDGGQRRCFNNDIVVRADVIQYRARKAAEEIAEGLDDMHRWDDNSPFFGSETIEMCEKIIARHFSEGEECE